MDKKGMIELKTATPAGSVSHHALPALFHEQGPGKTRRGKNMPVKRQPSESITLKGVEE